MSIMTISGKAVRRRIKNSEEKIEQWQLDHQEAEKCIRFEKWLSAVIEIYQIMEELDAAWRTLVFRGEVPYNQEDRDLILNLFDNWLSLEKVASPYLACYDKAFKDGVNGGQEFMECCKRARVNLNASVQPTVSSAIGLREMTFDEDDSREIMKTIEQARRKPRTPVQPIETVDASFLLRK
jgi:hypothetical protein